MSSDAAPANPAANAQPKPPTEVASLLYGDSNPAPVGDPPASDPPVTDPPAAEVEEVEPSSLEELLEHLEIDADSVYKLPTTLKVNGKEERKTLAELRESAQIGMATKAELEQAKAQAKTIIEDATKQREAFYGSVATMSKLIESIETEIGRDSKTTDWNKLRTDDPAEYSARKSEIRDRRERLEKMKAEANEAFSKALAAQKEQEKKLREQALPAEQEKLMQRVPEWADPDKASAERSKLIQYLNNEGFTQQDIEAASYNGAVLALAIKAMRYDESKGKVETIKKKVLRIPKKVMKPGPSNPKPNGEDKQDRATRLYG